MKRIVILGATGSIGLQAIEVINSSDHLQLVGFTYNNNESKAKQIQQQHQIDYVFSHNENNFKTINNWQDVIIKSRPDLVVNSVTGFAGVAMTEFCLKNNYKLALANKESLVVAGHLIDNKKILPIDSEHSALYELINKYNKEDIKKIYITASGGPFYKKSTKELENVTFSQAIKHPTWNMGYKISIDSATLVNKCFEVIEAYYLFGINKIGVLYHPTSIVHGLIQTCNNALISYASYPTMKLPISLALNNYIISKQDNKELDLTSLNLYFEIIQPQDCLPLQWANKLIANKNSSIGTILTVVDDYVIELFRLNKIKFVEIINIIQNYIEKYKHYTVDSWNDIYELRQEIQQDLDIKYGLNSKYEKFR